LKSYVWFLFAALIVCSTESAIGAGVALQPVDYMNLPCPLDSLRPLDKVQVSVSLGEYEPLAVLVTSAEALKSPGFVVTGFPAGVSIKTYRVTEHRLRRSIDQSVTLPYFMEEAAGVEMPGAARAVYYLVFKTEPGTRPGRYDLSIKLDNAKLAVPLEVYPFRLRVNEKFFYGAFCGAEDVAITPKHLTDLHERGFDALQFFWGSVAVGLANSDDKLVVDFSVVDRWMDEFKAAGMRGPVVWSLGNDSKSHLENKLASLFHLPMMPELEVDGKRKIFADITNPRLNLLLKELMLAIRAHSRQKQWPELVFLIYDEPTERLMAEHEDRYRFIKSFWPELQIYGVTMNRLEWAQSIAHMVDIFVSNGDFARIRDLADKTGKPFWLYGSATSRTAASIRHSLAWTPWKFRAEAAWFWAYNYSAGDPYNDFDGYLAESTASMVWPPRQPGGPLVFSVSWEGLREATDDMRYLQTLEWMLLRASGEQADRIRAELTTMRGSVPTGRFERVQGGDAHDGVQVLSTEKYVESFRRRVAGWILGLLEADGARFPELRPAP
jgi:hypothetical protein